MKKLWVFVLLCSLGAHAAGVTDFEKSLKPDPSKGIKDAVILLEKGEIDDTFTSRLSKRKYLLRFKVFTRKGIEDWGTVKINYDSQHDNIGDIRATVWNPNGSVHELDKKDIHSKKISKEWGAKETEISFALPGLTEGSVVEYSYYQSYTYPRNIYNWYAQHSIYCMKSEVTFIPWPTERWGYTGANFHAQPKVDVHKRAGVNQATITMSNIPPLPEEKFSLPYNSLREYVAFYYSDIDQKLPDYWRGVGKLLYNQTIRRLVKPTSKSKKIAKETLNSSSGGDTIEKLYDYVLTNYKNYSTLSKAEIAKLDEHENKKELKKASYTKSVNQMLKRHALFSYQIDCLTAALIKSALPEAQVNIVLYRPWNKSLFNKSMHRIDQLTDYLVKVNNNGKVTWLAPGKRFLKAGDIPYGARGVPLLVLGKDGGHFEQIDPLPYDQVKEHIKSDIYVEDDVIRVKRTTTLNRYKGFNMRATLYFFNDKEVKDLLKEALVIRYGDETKLISQKVKNLDDIHKPLIIETEFTFPYELEEIGDKAFLKLVGLTRYSKNPFNAERRHSGIVFSYPNDSEEDITYHLPEDLKVDSVPRNAHVNTVAIKYMVDFKKIDDHTFSVHETDELMGNMFSQTSFPFFKNVYDRIVGLSNLKVALSEL